LIVASRTDVLNSVCDISITVGKRNIPAKLLYLGVVAILTMESGLIPPLLSVPKTSPKNYKVGDAVEVFGLNSEHQLVQRRTEISQITALAPVSLDKPNPTWRITNTEGYNLLDYPVTVGGMLIDPADSSIIAY
jgi:hypothetical protein